MFIQRNIIQPQKKKKILLYTTKWMNLKAFALSEISETQGPNTEWLHLHDTPKVVKYIEAESGIVAFRAWEAGKMEGCYSTGIKF